MSDLKETQIIYNDTDFYYETPIADRTFLMFYKKRDFPMDATDEYIIVEKRHENRPYVLSYDLYGVNYYTWIFAQFNMDTLKDPIRDLKEGVVLRVPTASRLTQHFGTN